MIKLGVNIDHVATLRQARYSRSLGSPQCEPDLGEAARAAVAGGADSITVHPRADGRHIQQSDARRLREALGVPLNMEMAATADMERLALELRPAYVCVVPEKREEVTTEGGLDVVASRAVLGSLIPRLQEAGIRVSLFIDPEPGQVEESGVLGADMIELHTGAYSNATDEAAAGQELGRLAAAAAQAHAVGLQVNAGHGLNYRNLPGLRAVPHLAELNIGHAIVSRALFVGLERAVAQMVALMARLHPDRQA